MGIPADYKDADYFGYVSTSVLGRQANLKELLKRKELAT